LGMPVANDRLVKSGRLILVPVAEEKGVRKKRIGHKFGNQLFLIVHEKTVALAGRHGQVSAVSIDVREGSVAQGFGSFPPTGLSAFRPRHIEDGLSIKTFG
jgi:hypothetical protein